MTVFDSLNEDQKTAVFHKEGPLLVIAGPGTGKTQTITMRLLYLLHQGVSPEKIIAITFTNRAAEEMKTRLLSYTSAAKGLFIGTFHRLGLEILKEEQKDALRLATDEELSHIINAIAPERNVEKVRKELSRMKNLLLSEDNSESKRLYEMYNQALRKKGLMDIDDLLLLPLELLENEQIRQKYQARFDHIVIDEYQDINPVQYQFIHRLLNREENIFAVGDADQAIYSFRGANVKNFLRFQEDFPRAKRVVLRENYRSTASILQAAQEVISKNKERFDVQILPKHGWASPIRVVSLPTAEGEAEYIACEIARRIGGSTHADLYKTDPVHTDRNYALSDFAILIRTHSLAPCIRNALKRHGIPCKVINDRYLHQFESIEATLAYMDFILNRNDESLKKILNIPPRGLGEATVQKLIALSVENGVSLYNTILNEASHQKRLRDFIYSLKEFHPDQGMNLPTLLKSVLETFNLTEYYRTDRELLEALINMAYSFQTLPIHDAFRKLKEEVFFDREADLYNQQAEVVPVLTIHSAKGLEFSVVFLAGAEQGIMPLTNADIEEERRLFYVGMTRAKKELIITHARRRFIGGSALTRQPSPFLDFNEQYKETVFIHDTQHKGAVQKSLF